MPPVVKVNLKLLQMFLLVAENASFRAAALTANRSQSAVSNQIKQLELQLGVALFHRTTRSVSLTGEGELLLGCVQRALQEVSAGLRKIEESVDLRSGHVSLGCSPTIAGTKLPYVLTIFGNDYPNVTLFVRELTSEDLYSSIRKRGVDFGIGPPCADPDLNCETILEEELYALVPQRLFATDGHSIDFEMLTSMPLLLLNPATALRAQVEDRAQQNGVSISTNYQFTQTQSLIAAATAGLGAAILPQIALPPDIAENLKALRIVNPVMTRKISLITLRGHALSPAAQRLADMVPLMMNPANIRPLRKRRRAQVAEI